MSIHLGGNGTKATGNIRVVGDTLYVSGIHFAVTPGVIDTDGMNLVFMNNFSDHHEGISIVAKNGSSVVQNNLFGAKGPQTRKKPWWRFW